MQRPRKGKGEGRGSLGRGRREEEWIEGINIPHGRLKTLAALILRRFRDTAA